MNPWESQRLATYHVDRQVEAEDGERLDVHTIAFEELEAPAAGLDVVGKRLVVDEGTEDSCVGDAAVRRASPKEKCHFETMLHAAAVEEVLDAVAAYLQDLHLPNFVAANDASAVPRTVMESSTDSGQQALRQIVSAAWIYRCSA